MAKKTKTKQSSPKVIKKSPKKKTPKLNLKNLKDIDPIPQGLLDKIEKLSLEIHSQTKPMKSSLEPQTVYDYRVQKEKAIAEFKENFRRGSVK